MAKILGEEPEEQMAEDLQRFKEVMETREAATAMKPAPARQDKDAETLSRSDKAVTEKP
jgi:uncharacterized membrane protein